ncbi:MAG: ATP-binding cassette domain-containing protein [Candidatus Cloacimonadota bacterium]|nr:ATP-binding cassette domain-containing protein [Candidatus Cloacimonadota bacterium]
MNWKKGELHKNKQLLEKAEDIWEIEIKAKTILTKLGFTNLHEKINKLSVGQRRKLDLARVLVNHPHLLLLDEPTNHLDLKQSSGFRIFY